MNYGYYNFYSDPSFNYMNMKAILAAAAVIAAILGIVLFFTFLKKNNEGRFSGLKEKIYNALTFNRFYTEKIIKFLYVIAACVITVVGLVYMVLSSFLAGVLIVVLGNVALRVGVELLLMFIMLCRKTVSIDRRLSGIEAFCENLNDDCERGEGKADEGEWAESKSGEDEPAGCEPADYSSNPS